MRFFILLCFLLHAPLLLASNAWEKGYNEGYTHGYQDGYENNYRKSYKQGFAEGSSDSLGLTGNPYKEGYDQGYEEGYKEGRKAGTHSGYEDGYSKGYNDPLINAVVDIKLIASNNRFPPSSPAGYTMIGFWDVDEGYGQGTDGSWGHYMMGLYIRKAKTKRSRLGQVLEKLYLTASNSIQPSSSPSGFTRIGYWDVDEGYGWGTNGSWGHYMMTMHVKKSRFNGRYIKDIKLKASNHRYPPSSPDGYTMIAYWDVDEGYGQGTDGSRGHYMMGLYVLYESE